MEVTVVYCGHEITLARPISQMYLSIDGKKCDSVEGIFKKDRDAVLTGTLVLESGEEVEIKVEYKSGGLEHILGTAIFYANGVKFDSRKTS